MGKVVTTIVLINIVMFTLQLLIPGFTEAFLLETADIQSRPWILITHMFMHGSISHILFNMLVLWMFGSLLETRIGTKRFLGIYFFSGLAAAFIAIPLYSAALGASGALSGVMGTVVFLFPKLPVYIMFIPVPVKFWVATIIFALIDVFGTLGFSIWGGGVAHAAHLAGLVCGIVYGYILRKRNKSFNQRFSKTQMLNAQDVDDYLRST